MNKFLYRTEGNYNLLNSEDIDALEKYLKKLKKWEEKNRYDGLVKERESLKKRLQEKNLACARCGTTKSVKYEMKGKTYCNVCVLPESLIPGESTAYGNNCPGGKCEM